MYKAKINVSISSQNNARPAAVCKMFVKCSLLQKSKNEGFMINIDG